MLFIVVRNGISLIFEVFDLGMIGGSMSEEEFLYNAALINLGTNANRIIDLVLSKRYASGCTFCEADCFSRMDYHRSARLR